MTRTTVRKARKFRRCEGCRGPIDPGDRYLEHVASPGHEDLGNSRWWRLPECLPCAERYGRGVPHSDGCGDCARNPGLCSEHNPGYAHNDGPGGADGT